MTSGASNSDRSSHSSLSSDDDLDMPIRETDRFGIQPYQFEPEVSDASSDANDAEVVAVANDQNRLTNSDW